MLSGGGHLEELKLFTRFWESWASGSRIEFDIAILVVESVAPVPVMRPCMEPVHGSAVKASLREFEWMDRPSLGIVLHRHHTNPFLMSSPLRMDTLNISCIRLPTRYPYLSSICFMLRFEVANVREPLEVNSS